MRTRPAHDDLLGRGFLLLLALRLLTTAFLLPPWAGFDEVYHQGYVEVDAEHLRWPAFREIRLPAPLVAAAGVRPDTNYETQQSPLYYAVAGWLLRAAPWRSPWIDLYLLRIVNVGFALATGWILYRAAAALRTGWAPVALLALTPGFAIAMARVCNDALCGLLISIAVLGSLRPSGRSATLGSAAAGLAPWAKLYGLAVLPAALVREATRRDPRIGARVARIVLILVPSAVLGVCSWVLFGHPAPATSLRGAPAAAVLDVPWGRDLWTLFKSHVWMSGMSFQVFPNLFYLAVLCGFVALLTTTVRSISRQKAPEIVILAAPLVTFGLALGYQDWRAFSYYGVGGGTPGWYLWAMAVPEMLLLAYGAAHTRFPSRLLTWILTLLLALSVLGDCAQALGSAGALVTTARGHLAGVAGRPISEIARAYFASRPPAIAAAALVLAISSWVTAIACILSSTRRGIPVAIASD